MLHLFQAARSRGTLALSALPIAGRKLFSKPFFPAISKLQNLTPNFRSYKKPRAAKV